MIEKSQSMQQTISGKFINNLLGTLCVSCNICASKVKILLSMNNPQVTKARDYKKIVALVIIFLIHLSIDIE
jgi:hypothetical protein